MKISQSAAFTYRGRTLASQPHPMAWLLWVAARQLAEESKASPTVGPKSDPGFTMDTYASRFWNRAYPEGPPDVDVRTGIQKVLRQSGNLICLRSTKGETPTWFVRSDWVDVRVSTMPEKRSEAKLTAREAGEDREPAPVEVRHVAEIRHVAVEPSRHRLTGLTVDDLTMSVGEGLWQCAACAFTADSQGSVVRHANKFNGRPHPDGALPCVTEDCPWVLPSWVAMSTHVKTYHREWLNGRSMCRECGMVGELASIKAHQMNDHGAGLRMAESKRAKREARRKAAANAATAEPKLNPVDVSDWVKDNSDQPVTREVAVIAVSEREAIDDFALSMAERIRAYVESYEGGRIDRMAKELQEARKEAKRAREDLAAMQETLRKLLG